jgi:hypothetical protein
MKLKTIADIVGVFVTLPIWYYLIYKILVLVNATELMFFLYCIYLPAGLFVGVVSRLAEEK